MAKHKIVGKINRKPKHGYYVDKNGNVREFKMGGRKKKRR